MPEPTAHDALIARLSGDLRPVARLLSPLRRTGIWLAAVFSMALPLAVLVDMPKVFTRLLSTPDMCLSQAGALITGILAAYAAFQTSLPGRSAWWALLPVPPLLLWVGFSTAGCMRLSAAAAVRIEPPTEPMMCMEFMCLVSLPMAVLLTGLLMRAWPPRPGLTALLGGLACAGAAASLLALVHPFDATTIDLLSHLGAVLVIVGLSRLLAGRALTRATRAAAAPGK